ncbi:hypothetical protein KHA80_12865 [Anaerobacillus sp. HL2]|nr:hypothetical protein KHA80_12865 [Anaerobacillus sp. HL2]
MKEVKISRDEAIKIASKVVKNPVTSKQQRNQFFCEMIILAGSTWKIHWSKEGREKL